MQEHLSDYYVKQAKRDGYPSRSAYKLLELQERDKLIIPGMRIVDLARARGLVIGSDGIFVRKRSAGGAGLLTHDSAGWGAFYSGRFYGSVGSGRINGASGQLSGGSGVIRYGANISGLKSVDQPKSMYLAELAAEFAQQVLRGGESCCLSCFREAESMSLSPGCENNIIRSRIANPRRHVPVHRKSIY